jgi:tRNA (guanine37-N1)-methyltransferase
MRIDVLTLFPEVFEPFLRTSIVGRAVEQNIVSVRCINIRDFAAGRHKSVDDRPFGGGPGMVLMCQPVFDAVESLEAGYKRGRFA